MRVLVALVLSSALALAQGQSDMKPTLSTPVLDGQKQIRAKVHHLGTWMVTVTAADKGEMPSVEAAATSDNQGNLTFDLTETLAKFHDGNGLEAGWTVTLLAPAALPMELRETLRTEATVVANDVSVTVHPVREGDDVVEGTVTGTVDRVRIQVLSPGSEIVNLDEAAVSGTSYSSGLSRRLSEGQSVLVIALKDGEPVGRSDYTSVLSVGFNWGRARAYFSAGATVATVDKKTVSAPETSTTDGVTTSTTTTQRTREFSSTDYFIGLNVDFNLLSSLMNRPAGSCARPAHYIEDLEQLENLADDWNGNSFQRRLKDLPAPLKVQRATTVLDEVVKALRAIADGVSGSQNARACSATERARAAILNAGAAQLEVYGNTLGDIQARAQRASPPAVSASDEATIASTIANVDKILHTVQDDVKQFRRSDPAAATKGLLLNTSFDARVGQAPSSAQTSVSAGAAEITQNPDSVQLTGDVYAPWWLRQMAWNHDGKENAIFLAPLARFGLLATDVGPAVEVVSVETDADGVETRTTSGSDEVFRHVYPSFSFGFRLGHFAINAKRRDVAPELISFLDFTYGEFHNFRQPGEFAPGSPTTPPTTRDRIPKRFEVHGRFKIPETPLNIGFTANVGPGPDDVRLFFGTRFDFSKAIARLLSRQ